MVASSAPAQFASQGDFQIQIARTPQEAAKPPEQ
jgi:hypothetical protein